jgi:DNA-binding response OmpR family regulator
VFRLNILVAEDETDILELLELHIAKEGYHVFKAENGVEAIKIINTEKIDLALLDVMMPIVDGYRVLKEIRAKSTIPVIFITAKDEDADKVLGLGLGADDYIVKPFNPVEVTARIKAQLRRYLKYSAPKEESNILVIGDITLDSDKFLVTKSGVPVELNAKEFGLLEVLMRSNGKIYTKKQLYELIWGDMYCNDENTVMVHISRLRDKLQDNKAELIKTVRGIGYKMEQPK